MKLVGVVLAYEFPCKKQLKTQKPKTKLENTKHKAITWTKIDN
jgi:hypothetical protein